MVPTDPAAPISADDAALDPTTTDHAEEEGRSADEIPLVTRKRRRLERAAQQPPPGEQLSEWSDDAHVVFEAVSSEHTPTQLELPPTISEAQPSPSRTLRRLRRLGDRPVPIDESSGHAATSQDDSSGPRSWVEQIAVSNRLAELEDEMKKLKLSEANQGQSTAALEKSKKLLEAERKHASDLASEIYGIFSRD
ncbi:60S ribosomal subunit assembly/export protein loc1-like [Zingiber officinale]|uniref:60S ribosomal subunit assembly/export protein loc1-like n=1 Tax=Zingiber officinale TaxID=94328 RepID=UPI001C4CC9B8|nr:60S ribosomal subunit assembly/export protein loc1-like [Zingiber officinale]